MTRLLHLTDIHFGKIDSPVLDALTKLVADQKPTLVVAGGDLTQRARNSQFAEARAWLDGLGVPFVATPGNHDIPLDAVGLRLFAPFHRFKRHFGPPSPQVWQDDRVCLVALNSARRFSPRHNGWWKDGALSPLQVRAAATAFREAGARLKVLVTHHPFAVHSPAFEGDAIRRAEAHLSTLAEAGVNLVLNGHLHVPFVGDAAELFPKSVTHRVTLANACTAASTRTRGFPCGVQTVDVEDGGATLKQWAVGNGAFAVAREVKL